MPNKRATRKGWGWVVVSPSSDGSGWIMVAGEPLADRRARPLDVWVRVGNTGSRLIVTGIRIGAREGAEPYEITGLRDISIGDILDRIRESQDLLGEDLLGNIRPADLTIHRGPTRDAEGDKRILETYEAKLAEGLSKTRAADATAHIHHYADRSHVYKRLARARQAQAEEEAATGKPAPKKRKQGGTPK